MIAWSLYIPVGMFILSIRANYINYNSLFTITIIFKSVVIYID
ncbi:membrane protein [Yersinia similis]|nr:membrane protein [Yersinia similis]